MSEGTEQSTPQTIEQRIAAKIYPQQEMPETPAEVPEAPEQAPDIEEPETLEAPRVQEEPDEIEIGDIHDLASHIGVDVADLYNIPVPYEKDGTRHEFTLGELKDRYKDLSEVAAIREQAEATLASYTEKEAGLQQQLDAQAEQTAAVLKSVHQTLMSEMQSINWQQLEHQNPGEWARLSEHYRRKQGELQQIIQGAAQEYEKRQGELKTHLASVKQDRLQREQQKLLRAIPEWRDDKMAQTERSRLVEYMRETGYTADEINSVEDHKTLVLARKAMLFDQLQKNGDVAKKRVVKIAKNILKPGARVTEKEAQQDKARSLIKAHKANPKSIDAAAARIRLRMK